LKQILQYVFFSGQNLSLKISTIQELPEAPLSPYQGFALDPDPSPKLFGTSYILDTVEKTLVAQEFNWIQWVEGSEKKVYQHRAPA
jgi:hypothetical protein